MYRACRRFSRAATGDFDVCWSKAGCADHGAHLPTWFLRGEVKWALNLVLIPGLVGVQDHVGIVVDQIRQNASPKVRSRQFRFCYLLQFIRGPYLARRRSYPLPRPTTLG